MHLTGQCIYKSQPRPRCSFACDIMIHVSLQPNSRVLSGLMGKILRSLWSVLVFDSFLFSVIFTSPRLTLTGNRFVFAVSPDPLLLVYNMI
jgi:hypothetical protein